MASMKQGSIALRPLCQGLRGQQRQPVDRLFQALRLDAPAESRRSLSTVPESTQLGAIRAAPEIDLKSLADLRLVPHARPVPVSPSYFSRQPRFNDSYLTLQSLMRDYGNLPTIPSSQVERIAWKTLVDFRQTIGEQVKASEYVKCIELVKRLHQIHPELKPDVVKQALDAFKREVQSFSNVPNPIPIDRFGRALGVGRRKASTARAWVVEGTGEVQINGKSLADAFGRVHDRESAMWALRATGRIDKYNVWALVEGGGTTGQAEALTLAIAKALMAHEPALKPALRRAGCVTRDPRRVERKKHGHVKARKMPAWVKR
ncbi:ribosomal protein S5 domain 2-type protein [Diplogelasinospora grovesii]|uniref:Small ribosomal subunit protein uS9m n=1 Tax=Diplogelasinospora grovesii TaxID=303347 RepID=A0AAN6N7Y0_9PEZI|nr:ribosomal protein S5 domain 2-type protein [Diplogelasinospora grovesii]